MILCNIKPTYINFYAFYRIILLFLRIIYLDLLHKYESEIKDMKTKLTLICVLLILTTTVGFAQKDKDQTIINQNVSIAKYHDKEELQQFNKGKLLELYIERIEVIVKVLPNIAFTNKPGVTIEALGIPNTKDHRKALEDNIKAANDYFENTIEFQTKILPYSDKSNLIAAILYYEQTLKSLHTYSEFNRF